LPNYGITARRGRPGQAGREQKLPGCRRARIRAQSPAPPKAPRLAMQVHANRPLLGARPPIQFGDHHRGGFSDPGSEGGGMVRMRDIARIELRARCNIPRPRDCVLARIRDVVLAVIIQMPGAKLRLRGPAPALKEKKDGGDLRSACRKGSRYGLALRHERFVPKAAETPTSIIPRSAKHWPVHPRSSSSLYRNWPPTAPFQHRHPGLVIATPCRHGR